ncbi:hypothetical protein Tco_1441220 [Tanacetum coccineum]
MDHKNYEIVLKNEFPSNEGKDGRGSTCKGCAHGLLRMFNAINVRNESPLVEPKNKVRVESPKIEAKSNMRKITPKVETKVKPRTNSKAKANGIRFVSTIVNQISTRALFVTRATHNFSSVNEAKKLRLETMEDIELIKAINEDVKPISGVT